MEKIKDKDKVALKMKPSTILTNIIFWGAILLIMWGYFHYLAGWI